MEPPPSVQLLREPGHSLYWHYPNYVGTGHPNPAKPCSVVRKGDWKLIESIEDRHVELYNLKEDLGEKNDLASRMPEKAKELQGTLGLWFY